MAVLEFATRFGGLCRKYTLAEYEERAAKMQKRRFGASGNLPARMVEVQNFPSLLHLHHLGKSALKAVSALMSECWAKETR